MLKKRASLLAPVAILALTALACTLGGPTGTDVSADALTQVAATIVAGLTGTAEALPEGLTATLLPEGGDETPGATSTAAPTATPELPLITVSVDTNCREGPGFKYLYKGALHVGEVGTIVGKSSEAEDYVVITHPVRAAERCWVWLFYATVSGSLENVPEVNVPIVPRLSAVGGLVWGDGCNPAGPGNPPAGCVEIGGSYTGDGVYNAGDYVTEGRTVLLGEGVCPATGLRTDLSDGEGRYFFGNLEAGTYCVSIQVPGPAGSFTWTFPTRTTGWIRSEVTLEAGQHNTEVNFGAFCPLC